MLPARTPREVTSASVWMDLRRCHDPDTRLHVSTANVCGLLINNIYTCLIIVDEKYHCKKCDQATTKCQFENGRYHCKCKAVSFCSLFVSFHYKNAEPHLRRWSQMPSQSLVRQQCWLCAKAERTLYRVAACRKRISLRVQPGIRWQRKTLWLWVLFWYAVRSYSSWLFYIMASILRMWCRYSWTLIGRSFFFRRGRQIVFHLVDTDWSA